MPDASLARSPFGPLAGARGSAAARFLASQAWFGALASPVQDEVLASVRTVSGGKGDVLLRAGDPVDGWPAVLSGLVKLQSELSRGRRQGFLGIPGGEWFGEGSVMKDEPRRYDVVALRDTDLLVLPRDAFHRLYATRIEFAQAVAHQLNMRLGQAMAIIETMRLRTPEQRVAMYLGPQLWHGSRRVTLSQEELGLLANLSRQTVNTVLNDFQRRGFVSLDLGRIEIRDEAGLQALVHPPS